MPPPASTDSSAAGPPAAGPPAALSFAAVADAYDRGRPGYPPEAARWLVGDVPALVLELGAGTGRLTGELTGLGHRVLATDPLAPMLHRLTSRAPAAAVAQAVAELLPLPDRSVDVVVSAQAFHWFDLPRALPEIARVLRPGGVLALVWNERDERIPWVRRLGETIGGPEHTTDPTQALLASQVFGYVESATFRLWQSLDRDRLRDLVRSRSHVATMTETDRERLLARVDAFYDEYGRGPEGMRLPYVTRCYRSRVRPRPAPDPAPAEPHRDGDGDGLLIDFS